MNCQTKLRINHLTAVKSVAILESNANLNFYTWKKTFFTIASAVQCLYKSGSCHRRIPLSSLDAPSSLQISAEDVLGFLLKVVSGILERPVPTQNRRFLNEVLWSDECQFSRQGTSNTQNTHYWSLENPHLVRPNRHQVRWLLNVWCGIWKSTLISRVYFDGPLTSESFTEVLSRTLADFSEDEVSLRDLSRMWYQHDGAPAHKSAHPFTFLAQTFDTRIIGYGCQQEWTP
ncbi:uncharacterized protein TNCV_3287101 [Trichonephila clavipes]|nr:uncharacterized protein TNCV_3287101 [Trichonephila clavipes]